MMPRMLVIDDDPLVHHRFRRDFEDLDVEVITASTAGEGVNVVAQQSIDVVLLDVMLPDRSGLETFREIHDQQPKVPIIFITSGTESETAIEAMKLGAYDYLIKPLDQEQIRQLVTRALEIRQMMERPVELAKQVSTEPTRSDVLIGRCAAMQGVYKAIGRVAPQDVTVLIQGESGTGKELVARAIYQHSPRRVGPFLAINCAAIPESLLESELFGHEKSAFTGADRRRIGKFEQCSGGTLFLDEIGDMTPSTQSKILRLLQEQSFERVGGTETITTDVRIIAATHRDLQKRVDAGEFRGDLFYRLNVFTIALPSLRQRLEDLPMLLHHFLGNFSAELGKDIKSISPEVFDRLMSYDWPGNVREFQSVVKQSLLHATGSVLLPDFLPDLSSESSEILPAGTEDTELRDFIRSRIEGGSTDLYAESLELLERELVSAVLRHTGGNKLQSAKILGITRSTLRSKMSTLGIKIEPTIDSNTDHDSD